MNHANFVATNQHVLNEMDLIGEQSGDFSLRCSDIAGFLNRLNTDIQSDVNRLSGLQAVMDHLAENQNESGVAARQLVQTVMRAQDVIDIGSKAADDSLNALSLLITHVTGLESQLRSFLEIIETIGSISEDLGGIAKKTRMLGLNAAIEASRGGPAAKAFGVVADEIRQMAGQAEQSAGTVGEKLNMLNQHARALIGGVEANIAHGRGTEAHIDRLRLMMTDIAALILQFEGRSRAIADCTESAGKGVDLLHVALDDFSDSAMRNATEVNIAREQLDELEVSANEMLNRVAHAGVPSRNGRFIAFGEDGAREVHDAISMALSDDRLSITDLFDTDYRSIEGSNPTQYMNRFVSFADTYIRPLLDAHTALDPAIVGCCLVDMNGFLPTHISERSKEPRPGDRLWNLENCRNRQIFMDNQTRRALDGDSDFFLFTYRQDMGEGRYRALRSVFVPLMFNGRRWGVYELGYLI